MNNKEKLAAYEAILRGLNLSIFGIDKPMTPSQADEMACKIKSTITSAIHAKQILTDTLKNQRVTL
ncbi:hypothetical protein [Candidatus Venteria ishoeyi]|uniref:Uncharacterized protein n=1 Tax=Candidatus Venteria ishoeyi TaxID=1899563 RepID=A0A1H6F8P5_9GAMM|nr:hypothetical protein [Candidatus Venteria ishoeyi]SEH06498.1 Uncharacterised protein [Candidatus Venteria ishoeyi]